MYTHKTTPEIQPIVIVLYDDTKIEDIHFDKLCGKWQTNGKLYHFYIVLYFIYM